MLHEAGGQRDEVLVLAGPSPSVVYEDVTDQAPCFPFYFRQVLAGPHENFHFVVGDTDARLALIVDPSFELERLFGIVERDGYRITDAAFTHGHWDHIGGAAEAAALGVERIHVHRLLAEHKEVRLAVDAGATLVVHDDGDRFTVGGVALEWLHTPGHQPESSCIVADAGTALRALFGGDTLFIDTCGRTDFPGGDTEAMFASMARLRGMAAGDLWVMPGHHYADRTTEPLSTQVQKNPALATLDRDAFGQLHCLTH